MPSYSFGSRAPRASQSGVNIVVDTRGLQQLARDLRRSAPDSYKALRGSLRVAVQPVVDDAKARAGFSKRIPATIRARIGSGASIKIVAGGPNAPDAAPLENKGQAGTFRHPVFGNREKWVNQPARPFLAPALDAHRDEIAAAIELAVYEAVRDALKAR